MTSVTQILEYFTEPHLVAWYRRKGFTACDKISEEAKRIGKVVDAIIQANLKGTSLEWDHANPQIVNCINAWSRFKETHPLFCSQVVGIQEELVEGELVGHPDLIVQEPGRWGIVDVKTSKAIYPRYWVQTGKYWGMKQQQRAVADPIEGCRTPSFIAVLRLDKEDGDYEYQELTDLTILEEQVRVFQSYYHIYQHGMAMREVLRQLVESEVLDVS